MMPDSKSKATDKPAEDAQALVGFMENDQWDALLTEVDGLIQEMDDLPYPHVKERVFLLLAGIDTIHREALRRLVRLFKQGVLEKVVTDPAIHTLMELYDMLPPEAAKTKPRGPSIQWTTNSAKRPASQTEAAPTNPGIPHWVPAPGAADMPNNTVMEFQLDDQSILLCRVKDKYYAIASSCLRDGAYMDGAQLAKFTLRCPHHEGCYYDIRQGAHIGYTGMLQCYRVKFEEGGPVMIGIDMDYKPKLPAF